MGRADIIGDVTAEGGGRQAKVAILRWQGMTGMVTQKQHAAVAASGNALHSGKG